jgi:type II secretory pathway component PulJ
MVGSRSSGDGFTVFEALLALAVLGVVVVVGLECIGLGAAARTTRAAEHAQLRLLLERKLAEVSGPLGRDFQEMVGVTEGGFEEPFDDAVWVLEVRELDPGSGLFAIDFQVRRKGRAITLSTYVHRAGAPSAKRRYGGP